VPITEGMKKGKEPMRTFGDLKQFFQLGEEKAEPAAHEPGAGDASAEHVTKSPPSPASAAVSEPTAHVAAQVSAQAAEDLPAIEPAPVAAEPVAAAPAAEVTTES
jgi:hypothetical protein